MNQIQHIRAVEVFALPHFILSNYTDIKQMRASFDLTEHGRWLADYVTVEHRFKEATTGIGLYSVIYDVKALRGMLLIYDKRIAALFKLTFASEEAA